MKVRDVFFNEIYRLTKAGEDVVVVSADIGAPSLDDFRRDFRDRFVNVGIAEQNLIAVSAGLSLADKTVISYGLNPFPITRAFDQIRNVMSSLKIPITLTALNAGTCSADAGFTHMAIENIALLRTLKNIKIISPTDETIAKKLAKEIVSNPYPRYVQFDKFIEGKLYEEADIDFNIGFIDNEIQSDVAVISSGILANELMKKNINAKIIDCYALPIDANKLFEVIKDCKHIITVEDGVINGGVGSMILEILNDNNHVIPVTRFGLKFENGYPHVFTNRNKIMLDESMDITTVEKNIMKILQEVEN